LKRQVTLMLSEFVANMLREQARAHALAPGEFLDLAARYYLDERSTRRPAGRLPDFLEGRPDGGKIALELNLEEASWAELEGVAEGEGAPPERVLEHALLLLVADLDSGRVATRFVEERGEQPPGDRA
jgi:hypothetical protein